MSKIADYLKETKTELKHVIWPTQKQTIVYTISVVVIALLVAYFLGFFDSVFSKGLTHIL